MGIAHELDDFRSTATMGPRIVDRVYRIGSTFEEGLARVFSMTSEYEAGRLAMMHYFDLC